MGCLFACFRIKDVRSSPPAAAETVYPEIGCQDSVVRRNQLAALILSEVNENDCGGEVLRGQSGEFTDEVKFRTICESVLEKNHAASRKRYEKTEFQSREEDETTDKFVEKLPSNHLPENKSAYSTPKREEMVMCKLTKEGKKVDPEVEEDAASELTKHVDFCATPCTAEKVDPGIRGSLTFDSVDWGFSKMATEEASSCLVDPFSSPDGRRKVNVNKLRDESRERSIVLNSTSLEVDRPIIGMVAAHWREDDVKTKVLPKVWDGNGIPNSTNKYKEDQRVSWHATPFEERLEKALSDEKLFPQRKLPTGKPITFDDE